MPHTLTNQPLDGTFTVSVPLFDGIPKDEHDLIKNATVVSEQLHLTIGKISFVLMLLRVNGKYEEFILFIGDTQLY